MSQPYSVAKMQLFNLSYCDAQHDVTSKTITFLLFLPVSAFQYS